MATLDPLPKIVKFLSDNITDPQTDRPDGHKFVDIGYPPNTLTKQCYPAIGVSLIDEPGEKRGMGAQSYMRNNPIMQIDCVCLPGSDNGFTISGEFYSGEKLRNWLFREIKRVFAQNHSDLYTEDVKLEFQEILNGIDRDEKDDQIPIKSQTRLRKIIRVNLQYSDMDGVNHT